MSIFSRVRDIISSNINTMLEAAENPEKLIKLMIREMEDTLVEIKASCAGAMAAKKKLQREVDEVVRRVDEWAHKSQLAVGKGRDDLAREALLEKRRYNERAQGVQAELDEIDALVGQYQGDITQIEDKLATVRDKQRKLAQREARATQKHRKELNLRNLDTSATLGRFENMEQRVERMEAEADLVNFGRKPSIEDEFAQLERDDEIEAELEALRGTPKSDDEQSQENDH